MFKFVKNQTMQPNIDQPTDIRKGEQLDIDKLSIYLKEHLTDFSEIKNVRQFPSGFSNLTYFIDTNLGEFVLRRPPFGANIKSAHDMKREFRVISMLQEAGYHKIPKPILLCEEETVLGAEFYLMERVQGIILRTKPPKGIELNKDTIRGISEAVIDNLVDLHQIDIHETGLINIGKPEGYIKRQVEGWIRRYEKAKTDEIETMDFAAKWMMENMPTDGSPSFIHNDYKYDNVVLNPENLNEVTAVLDWEMATVGDPLMDLGTVTAYWAEVSDPPAIKMFGLTAIEGNYTRQELLNRYAEKSGRKIDNFVFYFVFATYKLGVIAQQIYARFKKGYTKDPRFAALIYIVKACGENAKRAIEKNRISDLY